MIAVLLWALLALFTAASGKVPPFQLAAMSFAIGGTLGTLPLIVQPSRMKAFRQPLKVWLLGVCGLFGYHFFYFTALRNAPPVEAGLIAYLWPLLIVLLSSFLPGEQLKRHHVFGALIGFGGAALIVSNGGSFAFKTEFAFGYAVAFVCAFAWSGYSVLSRLFSSVPTYIVAAFCLVTAVLATGCHLLLEETVWPASTTEWLAVIGLGVGPVGVAFFVWDYGVKKGDIQVLGAASYGAPLLSTLVLVVMGYAELSWTIALACLLITGGACFAAKDMMLARGRRASED